MTNITLNNQFLGLATYIPNDFIDKHMTNANGEYVKIYLYLLRLMNQQEEDLSISKIADHFDHTEKDVKRALAYWEKLKLLTLAYDKDNNLTEICLLTGQESAASASANQLRSSIDALTGSAATTRSATLTASDATSMSTPVIRAASIPARTTPTSDQVKAFCQREEVQELIFLTETYLSRTISRTDLDFIFFWYDQLQFSAELIEFLIENCIAKGHSSLHYMQKVAEDWYARNIHTVEEAKQQVSQNNELYYTVMKALGIRGRNLVPSEMELLKKWSATYAFSKEIIAEACRRTIQNIHEPSFEYTDSILTSWHKAGLRTMEEIQKADEAYQKQQQTSKSKPAPRPTQTNKFNNFQQREYDYDQLERQLLERSMQ